MSNNTSTASNRPLSFAMVITILTTFIVGILVGYSISSWQNDNKHQKSSPISKKIKTITPKIKKMPQVQSNMPSQKFPEYLDQVPENYSVTFATDKSKNEKVPKKNTVQKTKSFKNLYDKKYTVQVGAFRKRKHTNEMMETLTQKGYSPYISEIINSSDIIWFCIRIGSYANLTDAIAMKDKFEATEKKDAVVMLFDRLKPVKVPKSLPKKKGSSSVSGNLPFSLRIASFQSKSKAEGQFQKFIDQKLSPYISHVKLSDGKDWYLIYHGYYSSRAEAEHAKKKLDLSDALIRRTQFTNLIGQFKSQDAFQILFKRLADLDYYPYYRLNEKGSYSLYTGAFLSRQGAQNQNRRLRNDGFESQVIER